MPPKTPRNHPAWVKRTFQDIEDKGMVKVISMAPAATEADKKSSLLKGVPFLHFVDPNVEDIDVVNRPRKEVNFCRPFLSLSHSSSLVLLGYSFS
jgi:hypothetical protein